MLDRVKALGKNKKVVLVVGILLALLASVIVYAVMFKNEVEDNAQANLDLDKNATEFVKESDREINVESIDIPGYPNEIYLEEGQRSTAIQLVNPEKNNVYFKFTISLGEIVNGIFEESEVLYESDLVEPGQVIKEQELNRTLDKGTHNTAIEIETYSLDTQTEMNGARTMTKLIVQ